MGITQLVRLDIKHGIQGIFNRLLYQVPYMIPDLALINLDDFMQILAILLLHGGGLLCFG